MISTCNCIDKISRYNIPVNCIYIYVRFTCHLLLKDSIFIHSNNLNNSYIFLKKDPKLGNQLGKEMENIIYAVARKNFLINNGLEDCAQYHIDEVNLEQNLEQNLM